MKLIRSLSLLLALTIPLAGCKEGGDTDDSYGNISSSSQSSISTTTESTSDASSVPPEEIAPMFPVVIYPKMSVKADGELAEVIKPIEEFGRFYATYLFMDLYQNYLFEEKPERFIEEITENGDTYPQTFTKVSNCGITTYSAMTEKLNSLFTEKFLNDTAREIRNRFRAGENDELFVSNTGAGGYLGEDYLRINKINYPDSETVLIDMSVIGEAEEWGYEQDMVEDFSLTLKRTPSGLKIDGFGGDHYDFYPLTLSFLQYNNVFLELDNLSEFELHSRAEDADKPNRYYRPLNETEEVFLLLENYASLTEARDYDGQSALYFDSLDYPDENTIRIAVTSRDAQGNKDKATAEFIRTADGLQLKAYDSVTIEFFAYYPEILIEK